MGVKLARAACALAGSFVVMGGPTAPVPMATAGVGTVPAVASATAAEPPNFTGAEPLHVTAAEPPNVTAAEPLHVTAAEPHVTPRAVFGWPLAGLPKVARPFEAPMHRFGVGHRGVDLYGSPDQPVLAAGDGTVVFAGMVAGRPVISVDHAGGLRTTYEPVAANVVIGKFVHRGDVLGALQAGHLGCPSPTEPANRSPSACLHWGVRRGEEYLDPLRLLGFGRVRLLPAADNT